MAESNVEIARRGLEGILRGDIDQIAELLDPEVKWHGGDQSDGSCHNREQALAFMRRSEVIRGGRFEVVDVVGAGERVVIVMRGPDALVANVATFRDGRVVEMVHYPSAADALAAVEAHRAGS